MNLCVDLRRGNAWFLYMTIIFPILTVILLLFFFFGLPELAVCELPDDTRQNKRIDRYDALIMAAVSLVYACSAFYHLGNTDAPQSFVSFSPEDSVTIELSESADIQSFELYSGLGVGGFEIAVSSDGERFYPTTTFEQNYVSIFKWNSIKPENDCSKVKYIRLTCTYGHPEVGEFSLKTDKAIKLSPSALTDEQICVPVNQNFLNSSYFDEIYHARTAYEHIRGVYPYEITHPPLGKLIISLGIMLFGLTPFGWRFSGTLLGVLMLPIMYIFVKKLFGGRRTPFAATAVFAMDFMHFVQTRIATIDTYAVFFILLMYLFMYLYVSGESDKPVLMLFLSGMFFGMGAASKWTCFYAGGGLAVIWAAYWLRIGKKKGFAAFAVNSAQCVVFFVLIPAMIYYCSYYPYGIAEGLSGIKMYFAPKYLNIVLSNQSYMFNYHSGVTATHPYSSHWYQWVFDIRPILYYLEYNGTMRSSFGAWVNPMLCWGGLFSLFVLVYTAVFRKDRKAAFILIGYLAQLLPWVLVTRVTFEYHYFPCTVFLCLALAYVFKIIDVGDGYSKIRIYGFVVVTAAVFIMFYPALSGAWVKNAAASKLMSWLPTWPF